MERETKVDIPGNLTLRALESSINNKENVERAMLVGLSKSDAPNQKRNVGVFIKAQRGVDVPELVLRKAGDRPPASKEEVFTSVVFVKDQEEDISGFR